MQRLWRIELLGGLKATRGEHIVDRFRTRKAGALLAYLAYQGGTHTREALMEVLWPEGDPTSSRVQLRTTLSTLRRQLEPPEVPAGTVIQASREVIQLNPAAYTTDAAEFEAALQAASGARSPNEQREHLAEAIRRYTGELLPGYFEAWILPQQQRLSERFHQALQQLIQHLEKAGDLEGAIEGARRAVTDDPLREEVHHELIRLLATAGQREAALRQYHELERLLHQESGEAPAAATRDLVQEIEQWAARPLHGDQSRSRIVETENAARESREVDREPGIDLLGGSGSALPGLAGDPPAPPTGTVTFLLTDIEGSTALWERSGSLFRAALARHHLLLRDEFDRHGGYEVKEAGDSFVIAFAGAGDAVACAVAAQRALTAHRWPEAVGPVKVRMVLHTGDVEREKGEYRSLVLHHAARMLAAAHGGQILCSELTAGLLRDAAPRSVEPGIQVTGLGLYRLRDVALPERLFQVNYREMPQREFPPLRIPPAENAHLPLPLTRFFGREAEIPRLLELLTDPARLVTVTGPGGSGKTRLAIEVARQWAKRSTAVYFVPLAELADSTLIPAALRDELLLSAAPPLEPLEQVVQALSNQPALLLFDNLEHLLEDGALLVRTLIERLPLLTCLVTSRQPLGLAGEQVFPVPPLPVPVVSGQWSVVSEGRDSGQTTDQWPLTTLAASPSVQIFLDRAQAVRPDFQLTPRNAAAVAELCRRLDGMPLALELAGARAKMLTVAQMLSQLPRRFEMLVRRRPAQPARHQSLRAALDWSYHLLPPELQRFFARLSIFRGGWTPAAAQSVCLPGGSPSELAAESGGLALDYLEELAERSFLIIEEGADAMRFRLLETLREYGWEQLAPEEREQTALRHAAYFCDLAEQAEPELRGPRQQEWLARLAVEEENLWAVLRWAAEGGTVEPGLRLAAALLWFWDRRGRHAEVRRVIARLQQPGEAGPDGREEPGTGSAPVAAKAVRARAARVLGQLAFLQKEYSTAVELLERSLTLCREAGDRRSTAMSLIFLADANIQLGRREAGRRLAEEGLKLWRQLEDRWSSGEALGVLARLADLQGDFRSARELYAGYLALYRERGDQPGIGAALNFLGQMAQHQGELEEARQLHTESLAIWQALGAAEGSGWSLMNLGHVARARGDLETARSFYLQAKEAATEMAGDAISPAVSFSLGRLSLDRGEPAGARALLAEALTVFEQRGERSGAAHCYLYQGRAARMEGDLAAARAEYATALTLFGDLNERRAIALSLEACADLAAAQGEGERAARLLGAANGLRAALGTPRPPIEQDDFDRSAAALRAALGDDAFARAEAEGRALSLEQAIHDALQDLP